jgi:hypothetical protein
MKPHNNSAKTSIQKDKHGNRVAVTSYEKDGSHIKTESMLVTVPHPHNNTPKKERRAA